VSDSLGSRILEIFDEAGIERQLYVVDDHGTVRLYAHLSNTWGVPDLEEMTAGNVEVLQSAYDDLAALGATQWTADLFIARIRRMRLPDAATPDDPDVAALFDMKE
jgi:hypothetical protein